MPGDHTVCIGDNAGAGATKLPTGTVIIGDNIRNLDPTNNKDAYFLTDKIVIGRTLFGEPLNLIEILERRLHNGSSSNQS